MKEDQRLFHHFGEGDGPAPGKAMRWPDDQGHVVAVNRHGVDFGMGIGQVDQREFRALHQQIVDEVTRGGHLGLERDARIAVHVLFENLRQEVDDGRIYRPKLKAAPRL